MPSEPPNSSNPLTGRRNTASKSRADLYSDSIATLTLSGDFHKNITIMPAIPAANASDQGDSLEQRQPTDPDQALGGHPQRRVHDCTGGQAHRYRRDDLAAGHTRALDKPFEDDRTADIWAKTIGKRFGKLGHALVFCNAPRSGKGAST